MQLFVVNDELVHHPVETWNCYQTTSVSTSSQDIQILILSVKVASATGHVARRVMARGADARLVFRIELRSIQCVFNAC